VALACARSTVRSRASRESRPCISASVRGHYSTLRSPAITSCPSSTQCPLRAALDRDGPVNLDAPCLKGAGARRLFSASIDLGTHRDRDEGGCGEPESAERWPLVDPVNLLVAPDCRHEVPAARGALGSCRRMGGRAQICYGLEARGRGTRAGRGRPKIPIIFQGANMFAALREYFGPGGPCGVVVHRPRWGPKARPRGLEKWCHVAQARRDDPERGGR